MIEIRDLKPGDEQVLESMLHLFKEVFVMPDFAFPPASHLEKLLSDAQFTAFAVFNDKNIIAGTTVYKLEQLYSTKPLAYIFDLAVKEDFQRRGIGKTLISHVTSHYKSLGFEEVFVQADKADKGALAFYRATMYNEEEDVSHFYYTLIKHK